MTQTLGRIETQEQAVSKTVGGFDIELVAGDPDQALILALNEQAGSLGRTALNNLDLSLRPVAAEPSVPLRPKEIVRTGVGTILFEDTKEEVPLPYTVRLHHGGVFYRALNDLRVHGDRRVDRIQAARYQRRMWDIATELVAMSAELSGYCETEDMPFTFWLSKDAMDYLRRHHIYAPEPEPSAEEPTDQA